MPPSVPRYHCAMRHIIALTLMLAGFGGFMAFQFIGEAEAAGGTAHLLEIDDAITPLEAKRFSKAIEEADAAGSRLFIVQLSTPGGLFDSTREIVESIFASPVPVVVYVAPSGARAASAGTFITAAAHVAAMAPATNIGAAAPSERAVRTCPTRLRRKPPRTRRHFSGASHLSASATRTLFRTPCSRQSRTAAMKRWTCASST